MGQQDVEQPAPVTLRTEQWKYYYRPDTEHTPALFDLHRDPAESWNAASKHPDVLNMLRSQLAGILAQLPEFTPNRE